MSGSAGPRDPELAALLLDELRRLAPGLAADAKAEQHRYVIHALKGSAAIAGQKSLADALGRIERRLLAGDPEAAPAARALLAEAESALALGQAPALPVWPEPPDDLEARPIDGPDAARYQAEMQDRLARLDQAFGAEGSDIQAALAAFREVHAMKGAALAVSDEPTAWFCHGLEERLREGERSEEDARRALAELGHYRGLLAELIAAPARALAALRSLGRSTRLPSIPAPVGPLPLPPRRPTLEPPSEIEPRSQAEGEPTLRVPTATLDRLFERVRQLAEARAQVSGGAELGLATARRARALRAGLVEALRLIGPPRPWGAPAAAIAKISDAARELGGFTERLERGSLELKETADRVRAESSAAHDDLAAMRTTTVSWLFERVAAAVSAQARRDGKELRLTTRGEQATIDRRVAEQLFDPILQLARNAMVHGLEPPAERALRGKPRLGTIHLGAEARSGGLRLIVQDDGAGVDVADLRRRAVARGTISAEMARSSTDETLLALLFVPGFTTRDSADLLAGRGVGLDLTLEAVHRLGGTIRLVSHPGTGLSAILDIPFEPGLIKVIWLEAGGERYALPVAHTRRILLGRDPDAVRAVPLDRCVRSARSANAIESAPAFAVEIELPEADDELALGPVVGVDRIGRIEEVTLRGISPLIAGAGPYAGAIIRGGELRLCLDAHALGERIGALQRPLK
ncbi:MAG: Hpt domain-containing protein [Byssovorax sp.]